MHYSDTKEYRAANRKAWMRRIQVEDPVRYAAWLENRARVKRQAYQRWKALGLPAKPRKPRPKRVREIVARVTAPKLIKTVTPDGLQMNDVGLEWKNFIK